jgi:HSP20 family molecular chaperone IbpA
VLHKERPTAGLFLRRVRLPANADETNVLAKFLDGTLRVYVGKAFGQTQHSANGRDIEIM